MTTISNSEFTSKDIGNEYPEPNKSSPISPEVKEKYYIVKNLCKKIRGNLTIEEWKQFADAKTDLQRMQLFYDSKEIQSCAKDQLQLHPSRKDKAKAMVLKASGNKAFGSGDNEGALQLYTESLVWMPHDETKDAAVVYANRSAALFHLNEFSLAEKDAELAFSLNYPEELHHKLYERLGRSCLQLGRGKDGEKHFKKAIKILHSSKGTMEESKIINLNKSLEELIKSCSKVCSYQNTSLTNVSGKQESTIQANIPEVVGGRGQYLLAGSKRLTLQNQESQGRFVTANEKFQPGDVILVEKPYVSALLTEHYHRQCFQCYLALRAPVPCQTCIYASYCSKKCRDEAWKSHHQYECSILGLLKYTGVSVICYLALRILTQDNANNILRRGWYELANKAEEDQLGGKGSLSKTMGFTEVYQTDHTAFFNLVTHADKRKSEDYLHQVIMAGFLLKVLKMTSYFEKMKLEARSSSAKESPSGSTGEHGKRTTRENISEKNGSKSLDELEVPLIQNNEEVEGSGDNGQIPLDVKYGVILLRNLQCLQFNVHETFGWDWEAKSDHSVGYGAAVYPTLALFNHSCNPAIVRYFIKDTVVVRAIRTILPGEVVTENYGPVFTVTPRQERLCTLMNYYWFQCNCPACLEDWPIFKTLTNDVLSFRCEKCGTFICKSDQSMGILFRCGRCSKSVNILKHLKALQQSEIKFNQASQFIDNGDIDTGLGILLENICLLDSHLLPPFRDYHISQEHARKCLLNLGNKVCQLPQWDPDDFDMKHTDKKKG